MRFRTVLRLVPAGTRYHEAVARAHRLLDPVARLRGYPDLPAFDARLSAILYEEEVTGPLEVAVRTFLDTLSDGEPFRGTVMVHNPRTPLRLSGTFRGRWTLVVSGSLTIDGLIRGDPARTASRSCSSPPRPGASRSRAAWTRRSSPEAAA